VTSDFYKLLLSMNYLLRKSLISFSGCDEEREISLAVFTNTFILGSGCFIGNIVATYLATKMQARLVAGKSFLFQIKLEMPTSHNLPNYDFFKDASYFSP